MSFRLISWLVVTHSINGRLGRSCRGSRLSHRRPSDAGCTSCHQHTGTGRQPYRTCLHQQSTHQYIGAMNIHQHSRVAASRDNKRLLASARVGFLPWQKLFLPGKWKKPVKTVAKTSKNWQKPAKTGKNQRHHKLITDFITHILQAAFEPYYNSGTDSEHK